jgi:hypothetical protein
MAYLQIHPKVYWIWNHRKWCLENVPLGPGDSEEWRCGFWKGELAVIEALLDADARNCEFNSVLQARVPLPELSHSSCVGLPPLCPLLPPFIIHSNPNPTAGTTIHAQEDRE